MATTVVDPQTPPENPFAEQLRRIEEQNAQSATQNQQLQQQLAELNRRTSYLPPAPEPRQQPRSFDFSAPDESIREVADRRIDERVQPAVNAALQAAWRLERNQARQTAAADPALSEIFLHFGSEIEKEMNEAVGVAGHVNPDYWKRIAKQIAFDQRDELLKRKRASRSSFGDEAGGGGRGNQPPEIKEVPEHIKQWARSKGEDPNSPGLLKTYQNFKARRRGLQVVA
jgi:hypothetical protein